MALNFNRLPEFWVMLNNLLNHYANSSGDDKFNGVNFYPNAYNVCKTVADSTAYEVHQIAAVMAVVSPGLIWDGNEVAPKVLADLHWNGVPGDQWREFGLGAYPTNLLKAERILDEEMDALRGPKTTNFYLNIMGDYEAVTVDRWMVRAMLNDPFVHKNDMAPSNYDVYQYMASVVEEAARLVQLPPAHMQAIVWHYYRGLFNGRVRRADAKQVKTMNAHELLGAGVVA